MTNALLTERSALDALHILRALTSGPVAMTALPFDGSRRDDAIQTAYLSGWVEAAPGNAAVLTAKGIAHDAAQPAVLKPATMPAPVAVPDTHLGFLNKVLAGHGIVLTTTRGGGHRRRNRCGCSCNAETGDDCICGAVQH